MNIRIAIVDDQAQTRELLRQDLLVRVPDGASIACFDGGEAFLSGFTPGDDALVFLDICMEGMNGIEVAQRVRKRSARCLIVFLTSSKEYAFDAFPIHPFDYLVKPYSAARLDHVLSGAIRLMEESEQLVEIHLPRQTIRLPHGQIVAVTSHGHALDIFTVSGACLKSSQTFAELEAALRGDERFLPCNRGVLVNMDEALKLDGDSILLTDGLRFPPAPAQPARFSQPLLRIPDQAHEKGVTAMFFARYAAKLAICCPFALLCYLPLSGFLRLPLKKLAAFGALGVTAFVGIGALACCRFQLSVNALLFPALLLFLLLYLKSVALPPSKALFVFFTATMLVSFSATLSCYLCAPLELHNDQPVFTLPSGLIGLALTFAVLLVFSLLFRRKIHWMLCNVSFSAIWRALFVAPLFLTGLFIWMTPIYPAVVLTGRVREISIVLLISFLSLLFWFYYFVYLTTRKMSEAAELHAQNQLLSMENTRYRELREHMDATRQLRHDFRQHLHVIAGLSEAKKYDKLNDYLAEYEGRLASPHTMLCANAALDAIAGHYQRIAETQNTRISWRLDLPERLPLDEVDLCMMLGNLLENALRAVCALPVEAREVRVVSGMIGGAMLGLSVENGYVGEIAFAPNGLPTSHKKDHGVGLASVAATVKRHNGTFSIAAKDGVFSAHILLSL